MELVVTLDPRGGVIIGWAQDEDGPAYLDLTPTRQRARGF